MAAGKVWLCALGMTYLFSCFFLIFLYESYFRGLVVGKEHPEPFDGPTKRRTASTNDRVHECPLHGKTIRLPKAPNVILAGAMKSGTTYFWHLLHAHPDFLTGKKFEAHFFDWKFAVPPRDIQRPSFWKRFDNASTEEEFLCAARKEYIEDTFKVSQLLKPTETRLSYEKTPNYMFLPQIPKLIHDICPWKPKIILILRNPVDRAYSHYVMDSAKDKTQLSFEEYIHLELGTLRDQGLTKVPEIPTIEWGSLNSSFFEPPDPMTPEQADQANWMVYRQRHMRNYLQRGLYSVQLERWIQYFPLDESLLVIHNDRLLQHPRQVMGEVLEFIGVPRTDYFADERVRVVFDVEKGGERPTGERGLVNSMSNLLSVGGYAPMSNATRQFLDKFFRPYNAELERLLGEEWKSVWT